MMHNKALYVLLSFLNVLFRAQLTRDEKNVMAASVCSIQFFFTLVIKITVVRVLLQPMCRKLLSTKRLCLSYDSGRALVINRATLKRKWNIVSQFHREVPLACVVIVDDFGREVLALGNISGVMVKEWIYPSLEWFDMKMHRAMQTRKEQKISLLQHGWHACHEESSLNHAYREYRHLLIDYAYLWSESDVEVFRKYNQRANTKLIGAPAAPTRSVVNGIGFATRGPEFISDDLRALIRVTNIGFLITVYYHPSYGVIRRIWFVVLCVMAGRITLIGRSDNISAMTYTKSRSIAEQYPRHARKIPCISK